MSKTSLLEERQADRTLIVRREVQAVIFDGADDPRKVLILKKTDYSRRCRWRLLKGGLNSDESEVEGLQREILEETGLKNIIILDRIYTYEYSFKNTRHLVSTYLVKADSQEPVKLQESEVADCLWTTKEKALQMLYWNNEKEALELFR